MKYQKTQKKLILHSIQKNIQKLFIPTPFIFFLPWKIVSKLLTIHYLSVQLSMITGKGFIAETSWLATLASARQKIAGVVYILLEIIAKQQHFLTRLGFNFFKLFTGGLASWAALQTPRVAKIDGFKRTWVGISPNSKSSHIH